MSHSSTTSDSWDTSVLYYTSTNPPYPASIHHLYHATASRNLSTSLPTTPASTTTDIDSAFCPQCLTSWDASTAFSTAKGYCMKSVDDKLLVGCVGCPECGSHLTVSFLDQEFVSGERVPQNEDATHVCLYKCGYCHWDSTECDIFQLLNVDHSLKDEQSSASADQMNEATKRLQEKLTEAMQAKEETKRFQQLQSSWANKSNQSEQVKRRAHLLTEGSSGSRIANVLDAEVEVNMHKASGKWDVQRLEEAVKQRVDKLAEQVSSSVLIEGEPTTASILSIENDVTVDDKENESILHQAPNEQARQQIVSTSAEAAAKPPLPLPTPLRARAVKRCAIEVQAGRPGILVKPKVNPLEGDTSLRYGHGQWWKKDSSAIHSIPRIQIKRQKYNASTDQYALLFQVKNPTLGPIRFQMHSNFDEDNGMTFPDSLDAVLDSMALRKDTVYIIPPSPSGDKELIALEASEDTFLDMGKDSNVDQDDAWSDADLVWSDTASYKLISVKNDVAWIQFITKGLGQKHIEGKFIGVPMMLEIEVGEDSWESSLIHVKEMKDGERDFVPFTILPVWMRAEKGK